MSLELDDSFSAVQILSAVWSSAVGSTEDPPPPGAPEMGMEEELEMDKHRTEATYCSQGAGTEPWESWTSRKKQFCCRSQGLRCLETLLYMHNCFSATAKWTPSRREWCCQHRGMSCNETEAKQLELEALGPRGWPHDCREQLQVWDAWEPEHKQWCCMVDGLKCNLLEGEAAGNIAGGLVAPQSGLTDQRGVTEHDCREGVKAQDGWSQEKKAWCWGCKTGLERWRDWDPYKKDFCCRSEGVACREAERYIHNCRSDVSNYQAWPPEKKLWCCKFKGEKCLDSSVKREEWGPRQFPYDCRDNASWGSWAFMQQKWCCKVEGLRCTEVQHLQHDRGFGLDAAAQPAAFEVPKKNEKARRVAERHAVQTSANAEQAGKPQTDVHPGDEAAKRIEDHQSTAAVDPVERSSAPPPVEGAAPPEGHAEQSGAEQTEKPSEHGGVVAAEGSAQQTEKPSERGGVVAAEGSAQQSSTKPPEAPQVGEAAETHAEQSGVPQAELHPGEEAARKAAGKGSAPLSKVVEGSKAPDKQAEQIGASSSSTSSTQPEAPRASDSAEGHTKRSGATPAETPAASQQNSGPPGTPGGAEAAGRPTLTPLVLPTDGAHNAEKQVAVGEGAHEPNAHERAEAGSQPERGGADVHKGNEAGKAAELMVATSAEECWKIGERVEISPGSDYAAQAHAICGTVDARICQGDRYKKITFDNGYSNWYEYRDLQRCATPP